MVVSTALHILHPTSFILYVHHHSHYIFNLSSLILHPVSVILILILISILISIGIISFHFNCDCEYDCDSNSNGIAGE